LLRDQEHQAERHVARATYNEQAQDHGDDGRAGVASHVGSRLLADLADRSGLTGAVEVALAGTRRRRSAHDPGRVLTDVAVMLADGGGGISGLAVLRDRPELVGAVASTATAWRVLGSIDSSRLGAIRGARAQAREQLWGQRAETVGPIPASRAGGRECPGLRLVVDATLVTCHSDRSSPARRSRAGSATTRCRSGWTPRTRRSPRCCGPARPAATPPPTTSR